MNTAARLLSIALGVCGMGALGLGFAFWSGYARSFRPLHIALGIGVVLCLWGLAGIAWRHTPRKGLMEVAHLAVGAVAIGVGAQLARAIAQVRMAPNRN